ncbi:MAG: pyridoxamine 5'-phosphate oxidase, partial [Betaproteobacteria bacterium]|nr:pyridoxamine 5'-phosphate oxidase [Betaproteobacteria bacterium]
MDLTALRRDYRQARLDEADLLAEPLQQFRAWFEQALASGLDEPYAMTLATVSGDQRPAARIVLLRGFDERGFAFFTNFDSRKGHELAAAPHAALLFYWAPLERQVRIEGVVARVPDADSDDYFAKRPRGSCIGAWASPQSQVIPDRDWLRQRVAAFDAEHGDTVPRPDNWGGYRLIPDYYEFWQGRES